MDSMTVELSNPCDDMNHCGELPWLMLSVVILDISGGDISEENNQRAERTNNSRKLNQKIEEEIENKKWEAIGDRESIRKVWLNEFRAR